MDLSLAASYFDNQAVYDSYSSALLGLGQPDLYDSTERDSETGWRRTMSVAPGIAVPARGCVKLDTDNFVVGRVVQDFFQGSPIRNHWLLHPAEGLVSVAPASTFLAAGSPSTFYAGQSWLKNRKFEENTSRAYPVYDFFCHTSETPTLGYILKDTRNVYHRIAAIGIRSGELQAFSVYQLGATAPRSISYQKTGAGAYNTATNSYPLDTAAAVQAFVEDYKTNYLYLSNADASFERSDIVVTVLKSAVADPKTTDIFVDSGLTYRVIARQGDGTLAWAIHARPE